MIPVITEKYLSFVQIGMVIIYRSGNYSTPLSFTRIGSARCIICEYSLLGKKKKTVMGLDVNLRNANK